MNKEFKVGDWVIFTSKETNDYNQRLRKVFLYNKIAKIIKINRSANNFLLEFKEYINGHEGNNPKGKDGHCWNFSSHYFKLAIDHLKFKKWIKG